MASLCDERFLPLINSRLSKDRTDYAAQLLRWSASLDVRKEGTQQVYTFEAYCEREARRQEMGTNPDDQELLRRAVAKRGPSATGWAWKRQPTAEERKVFNYFKRHGRL